jgi:hypothetical protein
MNLRNAGFIVTGSAFVVAFLDHAEDMLAMRYDLYGDVELTQSDSSARKCRIHALYTHPRL